jgi:hypothetical protein
MFDPISMGVMGGGALLGGALGLAGGLIQGDAAQNAAGAQLGYLDLARQQVGLTQQQQLAMLQPYQLYGSTALDALRARVMSGTERQIDAVKARSQMQAEIAALSTPTDWASFPNLTGPKASERKASMWQEQEFQRKQRLQQAQQRLASFDQEQAALQPLQSQLESELRAKEARVDSALGRISDINPVNVPGNLSQLRAEMENDPIFAFRRAEGERAINRAAAARGQYFSGAAIGSLSDFNMKLSGEETDKYFNRVLASETARFSSELQGAQATLNAELGVQQQGINNLYNLSNMGLQSATTGAQLIGQNSQVNANVLAQQGQAAAAGIQGKAAGLAQGLNSAAGAVGAATSLFALSGMMAPQSAAPAVQDGISYTRPGANAMMAYNPR